MGENAVRFPGVMGGGAVPGDGPVGEDQVADVHPGGQRPAPAQDQHPAGPQHDELFQDHGGVRGPQRRGHHRELRALPGSPAAGAGPNLARLLPGPGQAAQVAVIRLGESHDHRWGNRRFTRLPHRIDQGVSCRGRLGRLEPAGSCRLPGQPVGPPAHLSPIVFIPVRRASLTFQTK